MMRRVVDTSDKGGYWDILECGHRVPSLWSCIRRKHATPTDRECAACDVGLAELEGL